MNILKQSGNTAKGGLLLLFLFLTLIISGCGGGGGGSQNNGSAVTPSSAPLLSGIFVDSAVKGLEYETPTNTGITDADGTFMYHEGDTIRFYVGGVMLGEATAKSMMTPVDLVAGATDDTSPAVVNMARFLQTIDEDSNPDNGITITEAMSNAMAGISIDFNMPTSEFQNDPDVVMAMNAMNNIDISGPVRMMVSALDARSNLDTSIMGMMDNGYMMGSGTSDSSDSLLTGTFIDSPVEGLEYETPTHTGTTDANGSFMYHAGETIQFYVGDIMLGEATAKSVMTPVDLVAGATDITDPAVVNMVRFLMTIDADMNPDNGITITKAMSDAMIGHTINFNIDPDQFEYDPDAMAVMIAVNGVDPSGATRMMVSETDAVNQFNSSMNNMITMMTEGTLMTGTGTNNQTMSSGSGI